MKKRTDAAVYGTVMHIVPFFGGMGSVEPLCLGIGDPLEDIHIVVFPSANLAETGLDYVLGSVKFEGF